jgi:hypothetical protein
MYVHKPIYMHLYIYVYIYVHIGHSARRGLESSRDVESANVHDISIEIWEENEVSIEGYMLPYDYPF